MNECGKKESPQCVGSRLSNRGATSTIGRAVVGLYPGLLQHTPNHQNHLIICSCSPSSGPFKYFSYFATLMSPDAAFRSGYISSPPVASTLLGRSRSFLSARQDHLRSGFSLVHLSLELRQLVGGPSQLDPELIRLHLGQVGSDRCYTLLIGHLHLLL